MQKNHLLELKRQLVNATSPEMAKKMFYDKGMYPPRERIEKLLDPGTFFELDIFAKHQFRDFGMDKKEIPADGVITGFGEINSRKVCVYAQDFAAMGGSFGEIHGKKICALMDLAAESLVPIIGLCHSGGLRLQETLGPERMFGKLFRKNSIYSGVIPQISIILGVVAGGQAYSPGLTDFILMTRKSHIYIAGPAFVKAQTGSEISDEELGGAVMHAQVSGLVDVLEDNEEEVLKQARRLVDFLPSNWREKAPLHLTNDSPNRCDKSLDRVVPDQSQIPFDMHEIIGPIFDDGDFLEMKPYFARSMITGFARLGGHSVGVVANQPKQLGGVIDIKAAEKSARFVRFCDAFNIPIITLIDSPAYMIGKEMEREGMIYKGAKLLHAYAEATVPIITVIVRKAYAGAYIAMGSQYIGADLVYAWPGAEISSVASKTAASIIFRKEIAEAESKDRVERLLQHYHDNYVNPIRAASLRHINDIIRPSETRPVLIKSLDLIKTKKKMVPAKKHGNIPL
jgi:acetyl-CoA carboxylase carboxyltransferase component